MTDDENNGFPRDVIPYVTPDTPQPGDAPPPDPRSPVKQLLDMFTLESEAQSGSTTAQVNNNPAPPPASPSAAAPPPAGGAPGQSAPPPSSPPASASAGGAGTHMSTPATPFLNWHLTDAAFPDQFQVPLRVAMADAITPTAPTPPPPPNPPPASFADELMADIQQAISKIEHAIDVMKTVEARVTAIKAARALMPVIPQGNSAGMLQPIGSYTTILGGESVPSGGWMFQEPADSDYGKWFGGQLKKRYDDAVTAWNTPSNPAESAAVKKSRWGAVGNAAAVIAIAAQEAAPSGINTYDGRVLSWGIGLAAPGYLQKVMYFIAQDPKVSKAFYCCGFKYDADVRAAPTPGMPDMYHGKYQTVDLKSSVPTIVYGDNWYHDDVPRQHKKGDFQGKGFLALKAFTAQLELIYMLIQVARDPETRDVVFLHNYNFISGAARVAGFDKINSEALYVFIAQVQHNWGIAGKGPVDYALSTFDASDPAPSSLPSDAGDKAIAKGVVRLVMKVLQEQRFQNAVRFLKSGSYPAGRGVTSKIWEFKAATEFTLPRLINNYWSPLQTGKNTQDKSTVVVSDFPVVTGPPPPDNYVWVEGGTAYDFGSAARMRMRFPHDDFTVREVVDDRTVTVRDERTGAEHNEDITTR